MKLEKQLQRPAPPQSRSGGVEPRLRVHEWMTQLMSAIVSCACLWKTMLIELQWFQWHTDEINMCYGPTCG